MAKQSLIEYLDLGTLNLDPTLVAKLEILDDLLTCAAVSIVPDVTAWIKNERPGDVPTVLTRLADVGLVLDDATRIA